jgi:hypothetical protein
VRARALEAAVELVHLQGAPPAVHLRGRRAGGGVGGGGAAAAAAAAAAAGAAGARCARTLPLERMWEMDCASEGFSATMNTVGGMVAGCRAAWRRTGGDHGLRATPAPTAASSCRRS